MNEPNQETLPAPTSQIPQEAPNPPLAAPGSNQDTPTNQPEPFPRFNPPGRRKGKVARLSKSNRNKLNEMIEEGIPYLQIIERLGPDGLGLTEKNLSTWKAGGYLDWLRARSLSEAIQAKYEFSQDVIADAKEGNDPGRAILHTLATNLCQFLADTDPATLHESLLSDSDKFTRFVNAMVRLAEGGIKCELHKFRADDRATELAKENSTTETPGITPKSLHNAEQALKLF